MSEQQQQQSSGGEHHVCVLGAGTMGAGIAQVAAVAGWHAWVLDADPAALERSLERTRAMLAKLESKGRLTEAERIAASERLHAAGDGTDLSRCELLVEAIVEDAEIKREAIEALAPRLAPDAILATNTSSLSVTELGRALGEAPRVVGLHFFNPAPLLRLVEVVPGAETDPAVADRAKAIAESWGKTVAVARDAPGFIVNHCARPYYLEAFRVLEDQVAPPDRIDAVMTTHGGFRMGPLELTDLIGQDVNTATTRSVWERLDKPALLEPSVMQEGLVAKGRLGRKTGCGVYDYEEDPPRPAVGVDEKDLDLSEDDAAALAAFATAAAADDGPDDVRDQLILARVLVALFLQARRAVALEVARPEDVDVALRFGTNYPRGPFEWMDAIGADRVEAARAVLAGLPGGERFAEAAAAPAS